MRRVAWRSVRSHAGQFILTTLAVVLGAAFLSGTLALRGVLSETFSALTSSTFKADLYVSGSRVEESGSSSNSSPGVLTQPIDGSLAERISALDGVAAARPPSSTTVTLVGADQTPVRSNGAPSMLLPVYPDEYDEQLVSGSRPTGPDQIVLESDALKRSGLRIGDSTHMVVNGEPLEVRVVGEISYGASMAGATIVGMDPSWLMPTIAPDGKVSSISIHLSPGARTQQVCDEIRALLPQGERLQTRAEAIDEQNEAVENILGYVQTFLLVFVVLAMFVGSFIIMNTFAMSVRQRVKEFALLRAIGASVSSVFAVVIFFWMSFHQNGYSLTYFARDYVDLSVIKIDLGFTVIKGAEIFQSVNPLIVVCLTPLVMYVFGRLREQGKEPSAPRKIAIGMGIAAIAYVFLMVCSLGLPDQSTLGSMTEAAKHEMLLTPWVMVGMYFILTLAELFISPLGLSFVSKVAPPHLQGVMQGAWLAATALGNSLLFIGGILYTSVPLWACWLVFVGACAASMITMLAMVKWLERVAK